MKTEKDKLIDFLHWHDSILGYEPDDKQNGLFIDEYIKSINPQHENDGHQALEDNKDKKEFCDSCGKQLDADDYFAERCMNCDTHFDTK